MTRQEEFFKKYQFDFIAGTLGTGIFPSVKAAQAALESDYGRSIPGRNMFGIKAKGQKTPFWTGDSTDQKTREVINGVSQTITDGFRAYPTVSDSIKDHTYFLQTIGRYEKVFTAATPEDQARELQKAGYATDPNYANALISIINKYNLKELDKKKRS